MSSLPGTSPGGPCQIRTVGSPLRGDSTDDLLSALASARARWLVWTALASLPGPDLVPRPYVPASSKRQALMPARGGERSGRQTIGLASSP